ncbi:hypothetical protein CL629_03375 [bacterium]|nr:hypothetical protein [bacterium]|tara:strand:+ start:2319 stop:2819 length:501 start_codon:yes stop_codon:yes gene_type:complete
MKLYEISEEISELESRFENPDLTEAERASAVELYFEKEKDLEKKLEGWVCVLANKNSFLKVLTDKEKEIKRKKEIIKNNIAAFKQQLLYFMEKHGRLKEQFGDLKVSVIDSPPSTIIDDEKLLPGRYAQFIPEQITWDKNSIKRDIKAGEKVPGAHLETHKILRIK